VLSIVTLGVLAACGGGNETNKETETSAPEAEEEESYSIKVGVTAGPHEQVMEKVKEVAAGKGLEIELVVFTDYVMPNIALDESEIDANSFQHGPYLEDFSAERNLDITSAANTINFPMGMYSTQ